MRGMGNESHVRHGVGSGVGCACSGEDCRRGLLVVDGGVAQRDHYETRSHVRCLGKAIESETLGAGC